MFLVVYALDWVTGNEVSVSIFYLAPIAIVSWYGGRQPGVAMALLSAVGWYTADRWAGSGHSGTMIAIWNGLVRFGSFAIVSQLLSALRTRLATQEALASTDALTGLLNKRALKARASQELERARRYRHPLSAVYLDLDGFKLVNDRLGHATGDLVLQVVSGLLRQHTRSSDVVARVGGDEFVIILPETDGAAAMSVAQKLLIHARSSFESTAWPVSVSIGVVGFDRPPEDEDALLRAADAAMYEAKTGGKNRVVFREGDLFPTSAA